MATRSAKVIDVDALESGEEASVPIIATTAMKAEAQIEKGRSASKGNSSNTSAPARHKASIVKMHVCI